MKKERPPRKLPPHKRPRRSPVARPAADLSQLLPLFDIGGRAYFGYRMVLAAKLFDRSITRLLAAYSDLNLPQWRVIAQLGLLSRGTVRSLADGAAVDRAEISRAARDLEKRGLVRRHDDGPDRRSPVFSLTARGRRRFTVVRKPISRFIAELVDDVDPQDLEAANRVLWAITTGCLVT